jgi:hypothetical protein
VRRAVIRGGAAALALALAGTLLGCRIGEGTGEVRGSVFIAECLGVDTDRTDLNAPNYDLDPSFFAAEPVDDPVRNHPLDQLRIRLQHSGAEVENVDSLIIDVINLEAVAAHLGEQIPIYAGGALNPPVSYETGGQAPVSPVRVALSLLHTCAGGELQKIAVGIVYADTNPTLGYSSWIRFTQLGSRGCTPGGGCDSTDGGAYSVDFGEHLAAEFDLALVDLRPQYLSPEYPGLASGHITGNFSFIMRRGRVAQAFP